MLCDSLEGGAHHRRGNGGGDYHTAAQRPLLSAVQSLSRSVLGLVECSHILKNGKESALKLAIERWL